LNVINLANPTLSTASPDFVAAAGNAKRWRNERWRRRVRVPAITLDQLIGRYGEPRFLKLDVEGFEGEALAGLSRPLGALSFEGTRGTRLRARMSAFRGHLRRRWPAGIAPEASGTLATGHERESIGDLRFDPLDGADADVV